MMEINRLTDNEDLRQELWLYFLEGNSPFSLETQLFKIEKQEKIDNKMLSFVRQRNTHGFKEKF